MTLAMTLVAAGTAGIFSPSSHAASFYGPSAYTRASNNPFVSTNFNHYVYLEDFEDGQLDVPGVTISAGTICGPHLWTDSVDLDDGVMDGLGNRGHSLFSAPGSTGITFTFDAGSLGGLPTHVGIVWTDGAGLTGFEAYDTGGQSLGSIGPVSIADAGYNGDTVDDNFFGVQESAGISAIWIWNTIGGIEVDHLQYGRVLPSNAVGGPMETPLPGAIWLLGSALAAIGVLGNRRRSRDS